MAKLLYFGSLPDLLDRAAEDLSLPESVTNVESLLTWLRGRGGNWQRVLVEGAVQVTVNKQFAEMNTTLSNADEIAIISIGLMR